MKHGRVEDAFLARMAETIARRGLLSPGERVVAAVSGGVDSMVMLHALLRLGYAVEVAHFDHQTRNGESSEDAAFVRAACARLAVPHYEGSEAVETAAFNAGSSFEAYARERRYAFLTETARKTGSSAVATAHHEDDQAETLLMGMLGMASGFGLTGITPCLERDGVHIVRPMLDCPRAGIEAWAQENGIAWRDDRTNREPGCARNRVRLELMPRLETYNPRVRRSLARLADVLHVDGELLDRLAAQALARCAVETDETVVLNRQAFRDAPESLQRRMVKLLAQRMGIDIGYERITAAVQFVVDAAAGKHYDFGGGMTLCVVGDRVQLQTVGEPFSSETLPRIPLNVPGETCLPGGLLFRSRLKSRTSLPEGDIRAHCSPVRQYFDADKLTGTLYVRSRHPGDRMIPFGMEHARKVQDIMVDLRIPAWQRDAIPLLMMDDAILWMAGHTRSSMAPVDDATHTLLEVELCQEGQ